MKTPMFVIDTNVCVSRVILPKSVAGQAVDLAISMGDLAFSDATLAELDDVLAQPKFQKYISANERHEFFLLLSRFGSVFDIDHSVTLCRDPKDNKFLEVALSSSATCLLTGDQDLLELHPFRGTEILSPASFLQIYR
ncbi:MAG: putative toxin-antitoxin system toxin component, PIN family [Opitutales bacterium]|nr:putative toxin-antitoxin system toxin component, PIN family [Opitutales bacterium]